MPDAGFKSFEEPEEALCRGISAIQSDPGVPHSVAYFLYRRVTSWKAHWDKAYLRSLEMTNQPHKAATFPATYVASLVNTFQAGLRSGTASMDLVAVRYTPKNLSVSSSTNMLLETVNMRLQSPRVRGAVWNTFCPNGV